MPLWRIPAVEARSSTESDPEWQPATPKIDKVVVSEQERDVLFSVAQLWRPPATPIEHVSFAADPKAPEEIRCRFTVSELGGTTPKFDCTLENGEQIRVKYGKTGRYPEKSRRRAYCARSVLAPIMCRSSASCAVTAALKNHSR